MKRFLIMLIAIVVFFGITNAANEARFMKYPDIKGDKIVFSYEGDLWLTTVEGGAARRITSAPGIETTPKFSPDGKWIAFSGNYDGSTNVYVIPTEG